MKRILTMLAGTVGLCSLSTPATIASGDVVETNTDVAAAVAPQEKPDTEQSDIAQLPDVDEEPAATSEASEGTVAPPVANASVPEVEAAAVTGAAPVAVVPEESQPAPEQVTASDPAVVSSKGNTAKKGQVKKGSYFDQFKIPESAPTTCDIALSRIMQDSSVIVDFSNVSDFVQNGDAAISKYYEQNVKTNAFGTKSPNLYIDLSKTGVAAEFITKWMGTFVTDKRSIVLSISKNQNVDDSFADALIPALSVICYLNLSATSFTDAGLNKVIDAISKNGIGKLKCIDISETKVSDAVVKKLKDTMNQAAAAWEKKNNGAKYRLEEDGVIYRKPMPIQGPDKKTNVVATPAAVTPAGTPATVPADTPDTTPATPTETPVTDATTAPTPDTGDDSSAIAPIPDADSATEAVASDVTDTAPTPEASIAAPPAKKKGSHVAHAPKAAPAPAATPASTDASAATPAPTAATPVAPEASIAAPPAKKKGSHVAHAPKAAPVATDAPAPAATPASTVAPAATPAPTAATPVAPEASVAAPPAKKKGSQAAPAAPAPAAPAAPAPAK